MATDTKGRIRFLEKALEHGEEARKYYNWGMNYAQNSTQDELGVFYEHVQEKLRQLYADYGKEVLDKEKSK